VKAERQDARRSCTSVCSPLLFPQIDRPLICSTASKIGHLLPSKSVSPSRSSPSCPHPFPFLQITAEQLLREVQTQRLPLLPPLTLISRLKNDKNLSSAHPGNVSKTLKNFMNIVVVNVRSSKSVSVALEVACEFSFPSPSATHLPIVEKSGYSTQAGRPHRMSLHVLDPSLNVPSMSTLRVGPSGSLTQKPSSNLAMFNMRGTFSIVPSPSSPAWTSSGTNTFT
jgi:hypothetical protein